MGFSRQEYWSGLPFPPLGHLPNPGIESGPPALRQSLLSSEPPGKPMGLHDIFNLPAYYSPLSSKPSLWVKDLQWGEGMV